MYGKAQQERAGTQNKLRLVSVSCCYCCDMRSVVYRIRLVLHSTLGTFCVASEVSHPATGAKQSSTRITAAEECKNAAVSQERISFCGPTSSTFDLISGKPIKKLNTYTNYPKPRYLHGYDTAPIPNRRRWENATPTITQNPEPMTISLGYLCDSHVHMV